MPVPYKFKTIADVKSFNNMCGYNFFERGTMKFWKSIVYPNLYGGRFFVTSEQAFADQQRYYTTRCIRDDGAIESLDRRYTTNKQEALARARHHANNYKDVSPPDGYDVCRLAGLGIPPDKASDALYIQSIDGYRDEHNQPVTPEVFVD
jgi:hypothetical protein